MGISIAKKRIDILLIEDEPDLGEVFSRYLRYKGFSVVWACTMKTGLEAFEEHVAKLLIIDVQLPDGNGFDLAQDIVQLKKGQPIFFLTALHERTSRLQGLSLGAVDYIAKPFDMDEILLKIRNLLAVAAAPVPDDVSETGLRIGQLWLDMERYSLSDSEGKAQKLTIREAELLRHLILHKNLLVNKKDLLLLFWGNTDFFNGKSLEVFISRIRKLLQVDKMLHIESIYGAGYILHENK
ncbi:MULTISPECIES: response regulator transcription factor [Sphingobacterium]|uniref:DNA-binding response regulator n=1 Tax=Sphingobacterium athyrii TaxID=2152717 RepID=A0A363NPA4_9SPHI|nr:MULTISPECIES: response regulator transcription factor [Sphingobacterium]PUV22622.1 DNA-binding response regulator [Sphingobacterium athyrii]QIH35392.1 response regulator transcription factor [Sphingobacterium sp. DR205]